MQEGEDQADPHRREEAAHANGVATGERVALASDPEGPARSAADLPPAHRSRVLRTLYWALWFVLLPDRARVDPRLGADAAERRRSSRAASARSSRWCARSRCRSGSSSSRSSRSRSGRRAISSRSRRTRTRRCGPTCRCGCAAPFERARAPARRGRHDPRRATTRRSCATSRPRSATGCGRQLEALRDAMDRVPFDERRRSRGARPRRRRGRRAPRPLAQERGARVRRGDPDGGRGRVRAARVRRSRRSRSRAGR